MIIKTKPYPDITLEFDEYRHIFTIQGRKVPSVTRFTSVIDKSAALMGWQEKLTKKFLIDALANNIPITEEVVVNACSQHRQRKEEAAKAGQEVHLWAELFTKGEKPAMPTDERIKNGVMAFLQWFDQSGIKIKSSERHIYSKKYDYAGICDAEGTRGKKRIIIDYKTSNGLYNEMRYQVAAYQQALEEMTGKKYDERYLIRFDKETGDFHEHQLLDFKKDLKAFLACQTIRRREEDILNYR